MLVDPMTRRVPSCDNSTLSIAIVGRIYSTDCQRGWDVQRDSTAVKLHVLRQKRYDLSDQATEQRNVWCSNSASRHGWILSLWWDDRRYWKAIIISRRHKQVYDQPHTPVVMHIFRSSCF